MSFSLLQDVFLYGVKHTKTFLPASPNASRSPCIPAAGEGPVSRNLKPVWSFLKSMSIRVNSPIYTAICIAVYMGGKTFFKARYGTFYLFKRIFCLFFVPVFHVN